MESNMTKEEAQKEVACLGWQIDALMKKRHRFIETHMHLFADFTIDQLVINKRTLHLGVVVAHSQATYAEPPQTLLHSSFNVDCCIELVGRDRRRLCVLDDTANYPIGISPWMDADEFLEKTNDYYGI